MLMWADSCLAVAVRTQIRNSRFNQDQWCHGMGVGVGVAPTISVILL